MAGFSDYSSLLSGSTGSLGFGGVGGGQDEGQSSSAQSSASVGPISPSIRDITGGTINLTPTINFPWNADTEDYINAPVAGKFVWSIPLVIALSLGAVFILFLFRK